MCVFQLMEIEVSPVIPFRANVRSDPEDCIETLVLHRLQEPYEVQVPIEIVLAAGRLMDVPKDVRLDCIQPAFFRLPDQIGPHLRTKKTRNKENLIDHQSTELRRVENSHYFSRGPGVVDRAGEQDPPLAIDGDGPAVVGDVDGACKRAEEEEERSENEQDLQRCHFRRKKARVC